MTELELAMDVVEVLLEVELVVVSGIAREFCVALAIGRLFVDIEFAAELKSRIDKTAMEIPHLFLRT